MRFEIGLKAALAFLFGVAAFYAVMGVVGAQTEEHDPSPIVIEP